VALPDRSSHPFCYTKEEMLRLFSDKVSKAADLPAVGGVVMASAQLPVNVAPRDPEEQV